MTTTIATDAGIFALASVAFPDDLHNADAITTHHMEQAMLNNQPDSSYYDYMDHLKDQADRENECPQCGGPLASDGVCADDECGDDEVAAPLSEDTASRADWERRAAEQRAEWIRRTVEAAGHSTDTHSVTFDGTVHPKA